MRRITTNIQLGQHQTSKPYAVIRKRYRMTLYSCHGTRKRFRESRNRYRQSSKRYRESPDRYAISRKAYGIALEACNDVRGRSQAPAWGCTLTLERSDFLT